MANNAIATITMVNASPEFRLVWYTSANFATPT